MNILECKKPKVNNMIVHMLREKSDVEGYENEHIRADASHLNYALYPEINAREKWKNAQAEYKATTGKKLRSDATVIQQIVVQIPQEFLNINAGTFSYFNDKNEKITKNYHTSKMTPEREKELLDCIVRKACDFFGISKNEIIYAQVHKDETTPHLHLGVLPISDKRYIPADKKKGTPARTETVAPRISYKEYCPFGKDMYKKFHQYVNREVKAEIKWFKGRLARTTEEIEAEKLDKHSANASVQLLKDVTEKTIFQEGLTEMMKDTITEKGIELAQSNKQLEVNEKKTVKLEKKVKSLKKDKRLKNEKLLNEGIDAAANSIRKEFEHSYQEKFDALEEEKKSIKAEKVSLYQKSKDLNELETQLTHNSAAEKKIIDSSKVELAETLKFQVQQQQIIADLLVKNEKAANDDKVKYTNEHQIVDTIGDRLNKQVPAANKTLAENKKTLITPYKSIKEQLMQFAAKVNKVFKDIATFVSKGKGR